MAVMDVVFRIEKFRIVEDNESSHVEPFLIVVFVVLDGNSSPTPLLPNTRKVRLHAPGPAHGSPGPKAESRPEATAIDVPKTTGRFETQLATLPGFPFAAADSFTFIGALVVAMEEDATSDPAAEAGRIALADGIRKQLNEVVSGPTLNGTIDTEPIAEQVSDAIKSETVGAWNVAAVSSLVNLGEIVDPDGVVAAALIEPLSFGAIARSAPGGLPFSRTLSGNGGARYVVTGNVRRSDHPVAVAVLGHERSKIVVAREDSRRFYVNEGPPSAGFTPKLPVGTFTSGPAICRQPGRIDVFGRGDDRRILQAWRTGSGQWHAWEPMGNVTFRSGPAAVFRASGSMEVYAVGEDDRIWRRSFTDHWGSWNSGLGAASTGTFLPAAPAVTTWRGAPYQTFDNEHIDLFALGKDTQIYHASTDRGGTTWEPWTPVGYGRFFSGPSAVSWGANRIDIVALGLDRRCYHITWHNGWTAWSPIHAGTFFAGPGISSHGPNHLEVFAVGDDRRMWRSEWLPGQGWSEWKDDMGNLRFT